ncbi:efflux RND transporter periplasmic adaptor subunit [Vibrio astriarenae]|uniref:Efflux RND transporter periplasmic adaptor subunit n=1 Tax=Vibrio astriarenae TaxID=1481923 RepID=A0A7Z2T4N3_9VIBR|nr:efflux RND transporter periplasmic adaptor subunit [Vibrio astriarenae]QIA64166.1 efflux RND transporter periplasmic adaptor subunit [Vibrio astriarenae]
MSKLPSVGLGRLGAQFTQRPWIISALLLILLTLWLAMGPAQADSPPGNNKDQAVPLAKVVFESFRAEDTFKSIDLYGRTAPNKSANIGAEHPGKIASLAVKKGDQVEKGQVIAQIDKGDLDIQMARASAMLKVREKEYNAAQSLKNKGLQGEVAFASAQASLAEAKAMVSAVHLSLRNTQVLAPFKGIVDNLHIELGDYVAVGDPIAHLIDLEKVVIEADVSERHVQDLDLGQQAQIRFIDGNQATGKVRYISRVSSQTTNTFPIEIEIENPQQRIPAGISSEVELALRETQAVKVTPAMLALDESGNLGVKTLIDDRVKFVPIQLVKAEQDGVWLSGLGKQVNIITTGQGFVRDGDQVIATQAN